MHRWGHLAHSFGPELVSWVLKRHAPVGASALLDPFCGAGTALVAARSAGLVPMGGDLSPYALVLSKLKTAAPGRLDPDALREAGAEVGARASARRRAGEFEPPDTTALRRMLDRPVYDEALRIAGIGAALCATERLVGDAVLVSLLSSLPAHALLVRKGGWLAWAERTVAAVGRDPAALRREVAARLGEMADDLRGGLFGAGPETGAGGPIGVVAKADARELPFKDSSADVVVTSPPYANRHDYSRAYALELAFLVDERELRRFRATHFEPHPEAHPEERFRDGGAARPPSARRVADAVELAAEEVGDRSNLRYRVPRMLRGYGADAVISAAEMARVLRPGGVAAVVVGNSSYAGIEYEADVIWAEALSAAGLFVEEVAVARERPPSPQQTLGGSVLRRRESVITARKPIARSVRGPE